MIDPSTGEIIPDKPPKRASFQVSLLQTEMAIWKMQKTGSLEALIAIKDKARAYGLIKSHETKLREAFAYNYRRLKPKPSETEKEDAKKEARD